MFPRVRAHRILLLLLLAVASVGLRPTQAPAQSTDAQQLRNELKRIDSEIKSLGDQIAVLAEQYKDAQAGVADTEAKAKQAAAAVEVARALAVQAQAQLTQAQTTMEQLTQKLDEEARKGEARQALQRARDAALSEYEAARQRVVTPLQQSAEYQATQALLAQIRLQIDAVSASDRPDPNHRTYLASKVIELERKLRELEERALAIDPQAAAARKKLDEAEAALAAQVTQDRETMQADAQYQSAASTVRDAKIAANKTIKDTNNADAQARGAHNEQLRAEQKVATIQARGQQLEAYRAQRMERRARILSELRKH